MLQKEKEVVHKKHRYKGPILMVIGLLLVVVVICNELRNYYNEKALLATVEQLLEEKKEEPAMNEDEELPPVAEEPQTVPQTEDNAEELPNLIGKMIIDCIDLEVSIAEGTDKKDLRSSVGHMVGTALPGSGNCVIAGHRNYSFGRFFNRLNEVQVGDEIKIETTDGKIYTYQVNEISIVEPEDVSILEQTQDEILTLITCTPIYIASHRLIVEAKLIG